MILIGIGLLPVVMIYWRFSSEEDAALVTDLGLILFSVFIFGLIVLFLVIRLKTRIDENEVQINFYPLLKKQVKWEDIKSVEVVNYGFVGGWGIRLWTRYGTVYNIKGRKGIAIELRNGKRFLLGTQKEAELEKVVEEVDEFSRS